MRSLLPLIAALVVAGGAGCQSRATLTQAPEFGGATQAQKFSSNMAVFAVDGNNRRTIVLALQGTGLQPAAPAAPLPEGVTLGPQQDPLPYRLYLLLIVQGGGKGEPESFQVGQRLPGGPVCATYYVYDETGQANIVPDSRGKIELKAWPLIGGLDRSDWWVSGTFDLVMSNQVALSGSFVARPSPVLVERFLRNRRL